MGLNAKKVINSTKPIFHKVPPETPKGQIGYDNVRDDIERVKKAREIVTEELTVHNNITVGGNIDCTQFNLEGNLLVLNGLTVQFLVDYLTGNVEIAGQLSIDGASRVRVTKDDAQSIPHGTETKIQYDDETYDNLGEYNNTTHRFTAAKAGYYLIQASVCTADIAWSAGEKLYLLIKKNGNHVSYKYHEVEGNITSFIEIQITDIISLDVDDYIEIYFYQGSGGAINTFSSAEVNYFCVHRLS